MSLTLCCGQGVQKCEFHASLYVFTVQATHSPSSPYDPGAQPVHTPAFPLKPASQAQLSIDVWELNACPLFDGHAVHSMAPDKALYVLFPHVLHVLFASALKKPGTHAEQVSVVPNASAAYPA